MNAGLTQPAEQMGPRLRRGQPALRVARKPLHRHPAGQRVVHLLSSQYKVSVRLHRRSGELERLSARPRPRDPESGHRGRPGQTEVGHRDIGHRNQVRARERVDRNREDHRPRRHHATQVVHRRPRKGQRLGDLDPLVNVGDLGGAEDESRPNRETRAHAPRRNLTFGRVLIQGHRHVQRGDLDLPTGAEHVSLE